MDRLFFKHAKPDEERPPVRMSTPAGDRLETIIEGRADGEGRSKRSSRLSFQKRSSMLGLPVPRESIENSYTTIWSDGVVAEKEPQQPNRGWRNSKFLAGRGGWKRLLFFILVVLLLVIAVILGLVLGLKAGDK